MASPTDVMNGDGELPAGPRLRALAGELVRLQPSGTDPESYFVTKDRIVTELRRLSRQVDYRPHLPTACGQVVRSYRPTTQIPSAPLLPSGLASLPRLSVHCRFCIRRQAAQRRKRLQLGTGDLFEWAERAGFVL